MTTVFGAVSGAQLLDLGVNLLQQRRGVANLADDNRDLRRVHFDQRVAGDVCISLCPAIVEAARIQGSESETTEAAALGQADAGGYA